MGVIPASSCLEKTKRLAESIALEQGIQSTSERTIFFLQCPVSPPFISACLYIRKHSSSALPAQAHYAASDGLICAELQIIARRPDGCQNLFSTDAGSVFPAPARVGCVDRYVEERIGREVFLGPQRPALNGPRIPVDAYACNDLGGIEGEIAEIVFWQNHQRVSDLIAPVVAGVQVR